MRKCSLPDVSHKYDENEIPLIIKDQLFYKCPVGSLDWDTWNAAYEAYQIMDSGHLMYEGGMSNQTDFFVQSSYLVKNKLKEKEIAEIKKANKSSKKKS